MIIACVSPAEAAAAESALTLDFAARAKRIRNAARVNRDTREDTALLRAEIERLRRCRQTLCSSNPPLSHHLITSPPQTSSMQPLLVGH